MSAPARTVAAPRHTGRPSLLPVGMVLFLGSELMFFGALFGMYFTLRGQAPAWPPAGIHLETRNPAIFTALLIASSGTMQMAIRRIRAGDRRGMVRWVWLTLILGAAFLVGQGIDYRWLDFHVATDAYGSAFYTMTGFHAFHVFAGLVLMLVVLGRAAAGAYSADDHAGLEAVSYYWHFVDVVWIALFTTLFLIR